MTKTDPNYKILGLGAALMLPPAWIVLDGLQAGAGMPLPVAIFTVGGLMAISIVMIYQGLLSTEKGYVRSALVEFLVAGAVMLSEFAGQWWFAITLHHPLVTALPLSLMAIGGAACIESELLRVWRENLVATGQQTIPRARCPRELSRLYPEVAEIFDRIAVRYPKYTQRLVLEMAWTEFDQTIPLAPVSVRVDTLDLGPAVTPGKGVRALSAHAADTADSAPDTRTVSDLVREGIAQHGADMSAVSAHVVRARPNTNSETVRKAYQRQIKIKSA